MSDKPPYMAKPMIGLVGQIASGKSTVAREIARLFPNHELLIVRPEQSLLDALHAMGMPGTHENMQKLAEGVIDQFGPDHLTQIFQRNVRWDRPSAAGFICDGIRSPADHRLVRSFGSSFVIRIRASQEIRFERECARRKKEGREEILFSRFQAADDHLNEHRHRSFSDSEDFPLFNEGSMEKLKQDVQMLATYYIRPRLPEIALPTPS